MNVNDLLNGGSVDGIESGLNNAATGFKNMQITLLVFCFLTLIAIVALTIKTQK